MLVSRANAPSIPLRANADAPAWLMDLKGAVDRRDEGSVRRHLMDNDAHLRPDTLHGLLEQACRTQCSLPIKLLLATQAKTDTQRALGIAVEFDDLHLAEQLLKSGVDPHTGHLHPRSRSMHAMLQFPRRKAILYPPDQPRDDETDLDRALRKGDMSDARELLNHELQEYSRNTDVGKAWRNAVKHDRVDIQRGLLLLGNTDSQVRYRLREKQSSVIQDAGVEQVMKEIPYYSPDRGKPKKNNGVVQGTVCRHFVVDQLERKASDDYAKADFYDYRKKQRIKDKVSTDDNKSHHLRAHATESYLIDNRKFGRFLVQQFEAMEKGNASTKLMLMESTNHAMELSLRIKEKDGKKVYVARFFDPNQTTTHARSASTSLHAFEFQDLRGYLEGDEDLDLYYPESKGISMLHVYPGKDRLTAMPSLPPGAIPNRKLTGCIADEEIDATAIWHLMDNGFAGDLRRLTNEFERRPKAERMVLLAAKNDDGDPGLFMALQNGHADAVKAFGELLQLIPEEQHAELLAAKDAEGEPGLFMAFQEGHTDTVKAFGELLQWIPNEQRAELLVAKNTKRTPGLFMAFQKGHADAIEAYGKLLPLIPEQQRVDLLAAKSVKGTPGLFMALQDGHAGAIEAFGKLLPLIPEQQHAELLAAKDADGDPGLFIALQDGHAGAVEAFGKLLESIPKEQRAELLAAKDADRVPGLFMVLQEGHADTVKAFGKLLPLISEQQRAELLAAKNAKGTSGLFMALQKGHADTVKAFGELLQWIPEEQRAELLVAKNAKGTSGLFMALQKGHADTVKAFVELLNLIPKEQRAELLAAKDADGDPGLFMALQNGDAGAVEAFGKLLESISKEQRAELLAAKVYDGAPGLFMVLENRHIGLLQTLIANGADINARDKNGMTAVMHAAANGQTRILKVLIDHGADINARTRNRSTALMQAAKAGHAEAVDLLIEKGANINARNLYFSSAVTFARRGHHGEVKDRLKSARNFVLDKLAWK